MQTRKKTLNFKFIVAGLFTITALVGCGPTNNPTSHPTVDPTIDPTTVPTVDPTVDPTTEPSQPTTVDPTVEPEKTIVNFDVYTLNDFHGATKYVNNYYPEVGLAKMSTIFHNFAEDNTSFFLSSGDMWQETIESNSNYGEYVTVAMNHIGLDAMTIGNHEFDWGDKYIFKNAELADYPFLAANIYERETGYLMEGVEKSTLIERDGLKVGVIGTIGPAQYSSISYQYVAKYEFESEYNHVVNEAAYLREQGADVIILSAHDGYNSSDFGTLKKELINEASIDMVIAGHTHQKQEEVYTRRDGKQVPLIQGYSSGTAFGHVNFTFNKETDELTLNSYKVENFKDYIDAEPDQYIVDLYNNNYNVDDLKVEHIVETKDEFSTSKLGILASTAIYEKISSMEEYDDYNILTVYHNYGRNALPKGNINYEQLFASYPFDNEIILMQVNQNYVNRGYNFVHSGFDKSISFSGKRWVAAIDYLAYKTCSLEDGVRTGLYVRDIVKEYLQNKKVVSSSDYFN